MTPQLIADLERARALIDTPDKWLQGKLRKSGSDGKPCRWCVLGACYQIAERDEPARYHNMTKALNGVLGEPVTDWNDAPERTHAEVLAAFDRAIANERSKA